MTDTAQPPSLPLPPGDDLAAIEQRLWEELGRASRDRQHEWHTPVLATIDGEAADARVVVLREVQSPHLLVYSDARAGKLLQLASHPLACMVFWSPRLNWQLRARISFEAQVDGLAVSSRWARLKLSPGARDYLSPLPPGAPLEDGGPAPPMREERAHFAVLQGDVLSLDWLELRPHGHRRARFDGQGVARWLQA